MTGAGSLAFHAYPHTDKHTNKQHARAHTHSNAHGSTNPHTHAHAHRKMDDMNGMSKLELVSVCSRSLALSLSRSPPLPPSFFFSPLISLSPPSSLFPLTLPLSRSPLSLFVCARVFVFMRVRTRESVRRPPPGSDVCGKASNTDMPVLLCTTVVALAGSGQETDSFDQSSFRQIAHGQVCVRVCMFICVCAQVYLAFLRQ